MYVEIRCVTCHAVHVYRVGTLQCSASGLTTDRLVNEGGSGACCDGRCRLCALARRVPSFKIRTKNSIHDRARSSLSTLVYVASTTTWTWAKRTLATSPCAVRPILCLAGLLESKRTIYLHLCRSNAHQHAQAPERRGQQRAKGGTA